MNVFKVNFGEWWFGGDTPKRVFSKTYRQIASHWTPMFTHERNGNWSHFSKAIFEGFSQTTHRVPNQMRYQTAPRSGLPVYRRISRFQGLICTLRITGNIGGIKGLCGNEVPTNPRHCSRFTLRKEMS